MAHRDISADALAGRMAEALLTDAGLSPADRVDVVLALLGLVIGAHEGEPLRRKLYARAVYMMGRIEPIAVERKSHQESNPVWLT